MFRSSLSWWAVDALLRCLNGTGRQASNVQVMIVLIEGDPLVEMHWVPVIPALRCFLFICSPAIAGLCVDC